MRSRRTSPAPTGSCRRRSAAARRPGDERSFVGGGHRRQPTSGRSPSSESVTVRQCGPGPAVVRGGDRRRCLHSRRWQRSGPPTATTGAAWSHRRRSTSTSRRWSTCASDSRGPALPDAETVDDWSQGLPLAYARELLRARGASTYDWRRVEQRINGFGPSANRDRRRRDPLPAPALAPPRRPAAGAHPRLARVDRGVPRGRSSR